MFFLLIINKLFQDKNKLIYFSSIVDKERLKDLDQAPLDIFF